MIPSIAIIAVKIEVTYYIPSPTAVFLRLDSVPVVTAQVARRSFLLSIKD